MRLVLTLNADGKDARFPIHYNEFLQGVIYRHLDECLAQVFHEEGIRDGKRRLKLFTFSRLLGPCKLTDGWLEPKGPLRLVIASPIVEFLESFACHVVKNCRLRIGSAEFVVESVEVGFQAPYQEVVILRVLSPITVYSTLLTREGQKKTYYYAPQEKEFERLVLSNLRRKVRIWTGEEIPEDGAFFRPYRVGSRNLHVVLYKGTVIKGWTGLYQLRAPEPYFRMALDAGIGSKNSQGFGCVELWRDVRQEQNMNASSVQRSGEHGGFLAESGKKIPPMEFEA